MATSEQFEDLERLQAELLRVVDGEEAATAATALSYVLVSVTAENAHSLEAAAAAIEDVCQVMKQQIGAFGVGRRHP